MEDLGNFAMEETGADDDGKTTIVIYLLWHLDLKLDVDFFIHALASNIITKSFPRCFYRRHLLFHWFLRVFSFWRFYIIFSTSIFYNGAFDVVSASDMTFDDSDGMDDDDGDDDKSRKRGRKSSSVSQRKLEKDEAGAKHKKKAKVLVEVRHSESLSSLTLHAYLLCVS